MLAPATVKLTPDPSFNFTSTLADYVNENEAAILLEQHDVPESFQGNPFLGSHVENDLNGWFAEGIDNPEARFKFSLNTCNGCHSGVETNTGFLQISPRDIGNEAFLSPFLTGTTTFDAVTGEPRVLNDLRRRRLDLQSIVCEPEEGASVQAFSASESPTPATSLAKGIQRVH